MANRPADVVIKQYIKDFYFTPNKYKLDDRFVIRDGKKHPFAILVPGGGYGTGTAAENWMQKAVAFWLNR